MTAIFGLLLFVAFIGLIVGLIRPKTFSRGAGSAPSRWKLVAIFAVVMLVAFFGIGATVERPQTPQVAKEADVPPPAAAAPSEPKPQVVEAPPAPAAPEKTAAPVTAASVSAKELYEDYSANEVAADQLYKGKALLISGTVQSIDKDVFNNIVVSLRSGNEFSPVRATLHDKHETMAAQLSKGQKIKLQCTGAGRIIDSPVARKCGPV